MNRLIYIFGLALCFLTFHQEGFAESQLIIHKTYVQPEQVCLHQGNLMIACDGTWIKVPNLSSDVGGIFVASDDPWYAPWQCPNCGKVNLFYHTICQRCYRPR